MISCPAFAQELVFAVDIIRHGERTPVLNIPKAKTQWREEELGQLTGLSHQNQPVPPARHPREGGDPVGYAYGDSHHF